MSPALTLISTYCAKSNVRECFIVQSPILDYAPWVVYVYMYAQYFSVYYSNNVGLRVIGAMGFSLGGGAVITHRFVYR